MLATVCMPPQQRSIMYAPRTSWQKLPTTIPLLGHTFILLLMGGPALEEERIFR